MNNDKKIALLEGKIVEIKDMLIKATFEELVKEAATLAASAKAKLKEGFIDNHNGPLEAELDDLLFKFNAAKRAIGLVNKLKNPDQKRQHQSRVMSLLNQIRSRLGKVADQVYTSSPMSRGEF